MLAGFIYYIYYKEEEEITLTAFGDEGKYSYIRDGKKFITEIREGIDRTGPIDGIKIKVKNLGNYVQNTVPVESETTIETSESSSFSKILENIYDSLLDFIGY